MRCRFRFLVFLLGLALLAGTHAAALAGVKDPIEGDAFRALVAAQDLELQHELEAVCARVVGEGVGCLVTGPMDPFYDGADGAKRLFHSVRVVCSDSETPQRIVEALREDGRLEQSANHRRLEKTVQRAIPGFRGVIVVVDMDGDKRRALLLTEHENRWLVWVRDVHANAFADVESKQFEDYALAVSDYLFGLRDDPAREQEGADRCPKASAFGLTDSASFYAPRPPYVIQGYTNYKEFLHAHEDIHTPFAQGILGFVPGDSLRGAMTGSPPEKAWPNKEQPIIQHEYRKFFGRGGNTAVLRTLDGDMIADLEPGEYFYCVGLSGRVRFGYEIPREEVARIEEETGREVPRANHAFLFPGEPVLTAGAFFVREGRIVEVDAHSGHYFYSNITESIREDVSKRSDEYLMTLGHFFAALDRMGVDTRGILVSKM
jgi:hypothetical protein